MRETLGIQPRVKSLRSSYTGLYPQRAVLRSVLKLRGPYRDGPASGENKVGNEIISVQRNARAVLRSVLV